VGKDDTPEEFGPFGSETVRYDFKSLEKEWLDKKNATLLVLRGADAGVAIPLTKPSMTLGRTVEADLIFHDEQISRRHASIVFNPDTKSYFLVDLGSTNGTFVNDQPVTKIELKDGDKIFLGSTVLKFMFQDDIESESGKLVEQLLFQDDLTGLVVKRRFYKELELQLLVASSQTAPLSVLMMDMDGLKKVNDAHGHSMGAYVISEVGRLIGAACSANGQACRFGGDEFVAYLVNTAKEGAVRWAAVLRLAVRGHVFTKDEVTVQVSISIGVATSPQDGKTLEVIVNAADKALYRAKGKGRDTVSD
jgi:two-component system cell cycle response regulator